LTSASFATADINDTMSRVGQARKRMFEADEIEVFLAWP
jgi:hypothetical protein